VQSVWLRRKGENRHPKPIVRYSNLTDDLVPWEETYADSSSKFRTKSKRIGRHPKVLYSDLASAMTGDEFERYLLVRGVNHITVPRGEHHSIGVAEKAIHDLSNMMDSGSI
jgi:hypothetical protein